MSEFERGAVRILGVLLVGILIILYLQLLSCTKPVPEPPSDYIDEVDTSHLV
jgi:hypothetical protein|tara:strand:- start:501 stop:656 length:156 start_codon:yes stop_codon:yes gene_type:complete